MPSEYVIYLSAFVIGVLALGAFTTTYRNLDSQAELIVASESLTNLVQDVARKVQILFEEASMSISNYGVGTSFSSTVSLSLPHLIEGKEFYIEAVVDGAVGGLQTIQLAGYFVDDQTNSVATHNVPINATAVSISGILHSSATEHTITLSYSAGAYTLRLTSA